MRLSRKVVGDFGKFFFQNRQNFSREKVFCYLLSALNTVVMTGAVAVMLQLESNKPAAAKAPVRGRLLRGEKKTGFLTAPHVLPASRLLNPYSLSSY